jgi:hypothetical protein
MKTARYLFAASVLASALSISAFAGTIHTGAPEPQPLPTPAPVEGEMSTPVNGTMHTGYGDEATAGDALAAGAVSVLQSVLSLL